MDADFLLLHRMQHGDDQAIEDFVRKYYPMILRYCQLHIQDLGYAEDITYNSKTNQLLVLNEKKVIVFDGDTLAYVRTVNLPRVGDAIAYVESTDQYAIMVDDRVEYYNSQFGYVCSFRIFNFGNGPYQICADDNYVYVMFVADDGINRNVHVYLHNGIALGKVAIQKC